MNTSLEQVWNEFAGKLRGFIRARVRDPATAEDLLQDVFVKIQRRLGQLESPGKLQAWVHQIARHAIIDHYRRQRETEEVSESLPEVREEEDWEAVGLRAAFRRMIESLPEPYREAVVLTELEGLTQRQLADRLGISLSGAKSRVQRGRARLRTMLDECCAFEFDRRGSVIGCAPRTGAGCGECG